MPSEMSGDLAQYNGTVMAFGGTFQDGSPWYHTGTVSAPNAGDPPSGTGFLLRRFEQYRWILDLLDAGSATHSMAESDPVGGSLTPFSGVVWDSSLVITETGTLAGLTFPSGPGTIAKGIGCVSILSITQAAYDALVTKDPTTLYLITED